jgi:peptidoglycan/xylan/chitin deacetylase (PgdA/CDA1 family)
VSASLARRRSRQGVALAVALVVLAIVGISVAIVVWRGRGEVARPRARFSGARTLVPMPSVLPPARLAQPVAVAIVRDPASAAYFARPSALDSTVARWRRTLEGMGATVRVIAPAEAAQAADAQVLVVPSSPCLGYETREAIERAAAEGRGLILTASTGVHDGGCSRVGYGLVVATTAASRADTLDSRSMVYVTIPASAALSTDLPPGARIEVNPGGHVALRRGGRDAFYSQYDMEPAPSRGRPLLDAAIVHGAYGRGRAVYWGFDLDDVADRPWSRGVLALLVRNSVAWAAGQPLASLEAWPHGRAAAAVLAQDVEGEFTNARHALDSLRAAGVPATYFLTSNLALKYRRLSRALAAHGEIGTHTDRHQLLGGAPPDSQAAWLRHTRDDLARLLGRPVHGLRPPEEQFDSVTLAAWARTGGEYVFGANDARVAAPELLAVDGGTIVLLARTTDDDVVALRGVGPDPVRALSDRYRGDFARIRALGGLYLLSYHSQLLARADLVPALARLARTIAADDGVWRTTAGEVSAWWRVRSGVKVSARRSSEGVVTILVRSDGPRPVADAVLRIVLGPGERAAWSDLSLLSSPAEMARVALPTLQAGEERTFRLGIAHAP